MTLEIALQASRLLYTIEECERIDDELSSIASENYKLLQIIQDAITAVNCYKDELNRKLDKL